MIPSRQVPSRCRDSRTVYCSRRIPTFSMMCHEARFSTKHLASTRRTPRPSNAMASSSRTSPGICRSLTGDVLAC